MTSASFTRRGLILGAGALGLTAAKAGGEASEVAGREAGPATVTPRQTEGPFYPLRAQSDLDADLTKIDGQEGEARGEIIAVTGRVITVDGAPIADALVDVWQANAAGRYAHERDPNPAPLDPHFQGWAKITTGDDGGYRLRTVKPGAYPVGNGWSRPPHIHFKVSRRGFYPVTTQMYFEGEPLNGPDRILGALPEAEQAAVIAARAPDGGTFRFDVVLAAV